MTTGNDATKAAILLAVILLFVPLTYGQKNNSPDTTVAVQTDLVMIPAVITNRSGAAVSNLKKEDFTLLEDGQERAIAVFEEVVTQTARPPRPRNEPKTMIYSNVVEGEVSHPRITVIVLDFINTNFADQARGRGQFLKYLQDAVEEREPVAVFVITANGIKVLQDFTTDPEVMRLAIEHFKPNSSTLVTKQTGAKVDPVPGAFYTDRLPEEVLAAIRHISEVLSEGQAKATGFQTRVAATLTLEAMQQIARAMEGIPGRKSLLWVSSGFPFDVVDTYSTNAAMPSDYGPPNITESVTSMAPVYAATWRALNQAQVSVYPVDIRGLQVELYIPPNIQNANRDFRAQRTWEEQETISTFTAFADLTGGKLCTSLGDAFHEAQNDSSHYYMLGYYLHNRDRSPGWHKLELKVNRADAKVRARNGFLVSKKGAAVEKLQQEDVENALMSPLDYTAIPFQMRWTTKMPGGAGRMKISYQISIPAGTIPLDEKDGNHLNLQLIAAAKTSEGILTGKPSIQNLEAHLRPETAQQIRERGVEYGGELELEPGKYSVRVLVRDELSGKMGSLSAPLLVSDDHKTVR